jgi:hypothetical protein
LEADSTDPRWHEFRAVLELRSRIEALEAAQPAPDRQAAAAEPEPQPAADQPAAEPPFKPGQIWQMRSLRVMKVTRVDDHQEAGFHLRLADYPFDEDTLSMPYRANGEAILLGRCLGKCDYDLIKLISGPK